VRKHWRNFWRRKNKSKRNWRKGRKYIWNILCIRMSVYLFRILSREKLCLKYNLLMKMRKEKIRSVLNIGKLTKSVKVLSKLQRKTLHVKILIEDLKISIINVRHNIYQNLKTREARLKPRNLKNVLPKLYPNYNFYIFQIRKISQVFQDPRKRIIKSCFFTWQKNLMNHK
jgi:hypothetical protein